MNRILIALFTVLVPLAAHAGGNQKLVLGGGQGPNRNAAVKALEVAQYGKLKFNPPTYTMTIRNKQWAVTSVAKMKPGTTQMPIIINATVIRNGHGATAFEAKPLMADGPTL